MVCATKARNSLREDAALFEVVPFARLLAQSLRRHAAGRRQHVAMEIALIALPAGLVDGEIRARCRACRPDAGRSISRHLQAGPPRDSSTGNENMNSRAGRRCASAARRSCPACRSAPAARPRSRASRGRPPMTVRPWGGRSRTPRGRPCGCSRASCRRARIRWRSRRGRRRPRSRTRPVPRLMDLTCVESSKIRTMNPLP